MLRSVLLFAISAFTRAASSSFLPGAYRTRLAETLLGQEVDGLIKEDLDDLVRYVREDFKRSFEWSEYASSEGLTDLFESERHLLGSLSTKRNPFSEFNSGIKVTLKKYLASKYEDCFMGRLPSLFKGPTETVRDLNIRKTSDYADHMRSIIPDLEVLGVVPDEELSLRSSYVDIERRCLLRFPEETFFFPEIRALVQHTRQGTDYAYKVYIGDSPVQIFKDSEPAEFWVGPDGRLRYLTRDVKMYDTVWTFSRGSRSSRQQLVRLSRLRVFSETGDDFDSIDFDGDDMLLEHDYSKSNDFVQLLKENFPKATIVSAYDEKVCLSTQSEIVIVSGKQWTKTRLLINEMVGDQVDFDRPNFRRLNTERKLHILSNEVQAFLHSDVLDKLWLADGLLGKISLKAAVLKSQMSRLEFVNEMLQGDDDCGNPLLTLVFDRVSRPRWRSGKSERPWTPFNIRFEDVSKAFRLVGLDARKDIPSIKNVDDFDILSRIVQSTKKKSTE